MQVLLILNPAAGKKKARTGLCDIVEGFCRADCQVTVFTTLRAGHAARLAAEYAPSHDLIVCCGGDGTLNEVVAGLLASGCPKPLGYIPAGTTNDFAASLRLPRNMAKATEAILKGAPHQLDAGIFNDRYFVYIASFGAFTEASYAAPQNAKNAFGHLAYVLEGLKDLTAIRPFPMTVEADGRCYEGPFLFGSVSNTTSIGGMVKLPPALVEMGDGRLEVLLIRPPQNAGELTRILQSCRSRPMTASWSTFFRPPPWMCNVPSPFPGRWTANGRRVGSSSIYAVSPTPSR